MSATRRVLYARGMPDTRLRALGESHSRQRLDNRPARQDRRLAPLSLSIGEHGNGCDAHVHQAGVKC